MSIDQIDHDAEGHDCNADPVIVIFRRWGKMNGGGVIALFPTIAADDRGWLCQSYEHVGQHGGANYYNVIDGTKPASLDEKDVKYLKEELEGRGYNLIVRKRWQPTRQPRVTY